MKYLLLILFFSVTNLSWTQITIDEGDMPVAAYTARISIADTLFPADLQTIGANSQWDFSSLSPITQTRDSFIRRNDVPFLIRIFFSGATVVRVQETPDSLGGVALSEAYNFYKASSSSYENQGLGAMISGIPLGLKNNPSDVIYRFPLNFGDVDSSDALAQFNVPGLFYIERSIKRWNEVDAWGTLTTPYGSFNALRVKSTILESDSIAADTIQFRVNVPKRREYKWLAKEERVPVLTVNTVLVGSSELTVGIQYVDSLREASTTSIAHKSLDAVANMYPNPAEDWVRLQLMDKLGDGATMEIYSMDGKKILTRNLPMLLHEVSISHLPRGLYQVKIQTQSRTYWGSLLLK